MYIIFVMCLALTFVLKDWLYGGMERALIEHVWAGAHAVYGQNAFRVFSCSYGKHIDIVSVASVLC